MIKIFLQFSITFILLAIVALRIDFHALMLDVQSVKLHLFLASTCCIIGQILFLSFRWKAYLNAQKYTASFRESLVMNIASHVANIVFVSSAGGILAKSALAIKKGLTMAESIAVTFLDRFMTLFALVLLSSIGLPFLFYVVGPEIAYVTMGSIALIVITAIIGFVWIGSRSSVAKGVDKFSRILNKIRPYFTNYKLMRNTIFYSLVAQILFILSVYILSLGMDKTNVHVSSFEFMAIVPILALLSSLPISIGGWGVREGAFVYGLGLMGFMPESALLLSIQVGLVGYIAPILISIPCLFDESWKRVLLSVTSSDDVR